MTTKAATIMNARLYLGFTDYFLDQTVLLNALAEVCE